MSAMALAVPAPASRSHTLPHPAAAQAHCDYVVSNGHDAVAFATWYNPQLQAAHLTLDGTTNHSRERLPVWAGGAWTAPATAPRRAAAMLRALPTVGGQRDGRDAFEPGLAPQQPLHSAAASPWAHITSGTCRAARARVMRFGECSTFAAQQKMHFLGRSVDVNEYRGCTVWEDTRLVEYNDHDDEKMGCNIAPRGHCVCVHEQGEDGAARTGHPR